MHIGFDMGGSKIEIAVFDVHGNERYKQR